jgi:hypothetical protein
MSTCIHIQVHINIFTCIYIYTGSTDTDGVSRKRQEINAAIVAAAELETTAGGGPEVPEAVDGGMGLIEEDEDEED